MTDEPKTTADLSPKAQTAPPTAPEIAVKLYQGETPIKVQAIALSENPAQCLAGINDTIAREDQTIGDILVLHTQPDKIIIRKGAETWELMFGRQ